MKKGQGKTGSSQRHAENKKVQSKGIQIYHGLCPCAFPWDSTVYLSSCQWLTIASVSTLAKKNKNGGTGCHLCLIYVLYVFTYIKHF